MPTSCADFTKVMEERQTRPHPDGVRSRPLLAESTSNKPALYNRVDNTTNTASGVDEVKKATQAAEDAMKAAKEDPKSAVRVACLGIVLEVLVSTVTYYSVCLPANTLVRTPVHTFISVAGDTAEESK